MKELGLSNTALMILHAKKGYSHLVKESGSFLKNYHATQLFHS